MSWHEVRFEELYLEPSRNGVYKGKEYRGNGIKMVNMGELFANDYIGSQGMELIMLSGAEISRNCLAEGDLLFGRRSLTEEGAGKTSIVKNLTSVTTFESSLIRARLDSLRANPLFYFYYLKSPSGKGKIRSIVSGTNVKGIRGSDLKNLPMPFPPIATQNRIADTLSAYDDLIETNNRRIQLLEEAARQLYQEWFVRLRFPGHEQTPMHEGLPEGWEERVISEVAQTVGGGTPKTEIQEYWDNATITWFVPKDITSATSLYISNSARKITESGLKSSSAKILPAGTILMTSRASIGFFAIHDDLCCTNQGFISLIPKSPNIQMYLLQNLLQRKNEIEGRAGGATFKEINKTAFRSMKIVVPNNLILDRFQSTTNNIFQQVRVLELQNQKLRQSRDLLLPRFMRGELIT